MVPTDISKELKGKIHFQQNAEKQRFDSSD